MVAWKRPEGERLHQAGHAISSYSMVAQINVRDVCTGGEESCKMSPTHHHSIRGRQMWVLILLGPLGLTHGDMGPGAQGFGYK